MSDAKNNNIKYVLENILLYLFKLNTYDPWYNKNLHPGERCGLHTEKLQRVIAGGHVRQQRCSSKAVHAIEDQ